MKRSKFFIGLLIGALLGLIVWYYQKSTSAEDGALDLLDRLARAEQRVRDLEHSLRQSAGRDIERLTTKVADLRTAVSEEAAAVVDETPVAEVTAVETAVVEAEVAAAVAVEPDDLTQISGIGPVYARRLNEAGVLTFADLVGRDPADLRAIVGLQPWHAADPADWVAQAQARLD